jgi:hypothetical protein
MKWWKGTAMLKDLHIDSISEKLNIDFVKLSNRLCSRFMTG